jgi:hypothetical protein
MESVSAPARAPVRPLLSTVLSGGCLLLAILLPGLVVYLNVASFQTVIDGLELRAPPAAESLTLFQRVVIGAIATIPSLCQGYGLLSARRCFKSFARGEYFSLQAIQGLRGFATGIFLWPMTAIVSKPLLTYLATLHAGAGEHVVTIGIGTEQLLTLLFAGIFWQIAGVMAKARRIAEENAQFV